MADKNKNLKPDARLQDPAYAAEIGRRGGIASGKTRRKRANLKKIMEQALTMDVPNGELKRYLESMGMAPSNANALIVSVLTKAINKGDYKAMESILEMTDQKGSYRDKREQNARIDRMKAETRRIEEETARKNGTSGNEQATAQAQAIAEMINNPASERTLEEYLGGGEDGNSQDE